MTKLVRLSLLIACLGAIFERSGKASHASHPIVLRAARLIDGRNEAPVRDAVVIVEDGKITAVGSKLPVPHGAQVIDLGDATLLPGLIDSHTHLLLEMDGTNINLQDIAMLKAVATESTAERALMGGEIGTRGPRSGHHYGARCGKFGRQRRCGAPERDQSWMGDRSTDRCFDSCSRRARRPVWPAHSRSAAAD